MILVDNGGIWAAVVVIKTVATTWSISSNIIIGNGSALMINDYAVMTHMVTSGEKLAIECPPNQLGPSHQYILILILMVSICLIMKTACPHLYCTFTCIFKPGPWCPSALIKIIIVTQQLQVSDRHYDTMQAITHIMTNLKHALNCWLNNIHQCQ